MKKFIALVITIFCTGFLFAQTAHVSGSVISQFGTDLDEQTAGFNVGLDNVNIKVIQDVDSTDASVTGSGESDFYGEVEVSGISLEASTEQDVNTAGVQDFETFATNANNWDWEPGNEVDVRLIWGNISAGLYLGPVTINMFANSGKTEIKKGGVDTWGDINQNAYDYSIFTGTYGATDIAKSEGLSWSNDANQYFMGVNNDYSTFSWVTSADTFYNNYEGIQATYSVEGFADITLGASSNGSWVDNSENEFAIKGSLNLTAVENLSFLLEGSRSLSRENLDDGTIYRTDLDNEIGVKLGYNLTLTDDISISPVVGADIGLLDNYEEDAKLDTNSNLEAVMWSGTAGAKLNAYSSTLTGYYSMNGRKDNPDSAFTLALDMGSVENLILQAAFEYTNLYLAEEVNWTGNRYVSTSGIHSKLGYIIPVDEKISVTPTAQVAFSKTETGETTADYVYYAKAGIDVEGLVENTIFTLGWDSNELSEAEDKLGQLVFTTRIAF